jgi:hypothetical protein
MAHINIPPGKRIAMVDSATWLFPDKTMAAIAAYIGQGAVDPAVLQGIVDEAMAGRDVQFQTTETQVQWRANDTDDWRTLLVLHDLVAPALDALDSHINAAEPHPAYDDIPSLTLLFENKLV